MQKLINLVLRRPRAVLVLVILSTLPFFQAAVQPRFQSGVEHFFAQDDPAIRSWQKFRRTFGSDEVVALAFGGRDIFSAKSIRLIRKLTNRLNRLPGVMEVTSLTSIRINANRDGELDTVPLIPPDDLSRKALRQAKKKALQDENGPGRLVSRDGRATLLLVRLDRSEETLSRSELLASIRRVADGAAGPKQRIRYSGGSILNEEITGLVEKDNIRFTIILTIFITLIVRLIMGSSLLTLIAGLNVFVVLCWGIGMLMLTGESLNTTTVIMGPVLLAVTFAASVHVLVRFRDLYYGKGLRRDQAVGRTMRDLQRPLLLTSLTTAIGYFSFMATTIVPVKNLGLYTGWGVLAGLLMTLTLLPALLLTLLPERASGGARHSLADPWFRRLLAAMHRFTLRQPGLIAAVFAVLLVLISIGLFRLQFNSEPMNYLHRSNPTHQDIRFIEKHLGGTMSIEVLVTAKAKAADFTHQKSLRLLDKLSRNVTRTHKDIITSGFNAATYFRNVNRAFHDDDPRYDRIPRNRRDLLDYYELADHEFLDRYLSPDRRTARLSFHARFMDTRQSEAFQDYVQRDLRRLAGRDYTVRLAGLSSLYATLGAMLYESQLASFGTAFGLIFIMMIFVCRSPGLTCLSMIPNMFPIAGVLGLMGLCGLWLDTSTIMIASVTLGIAVDDTIHFLTWYRRGREAGYSPQKSVSLAFRDTGKPILVTTVVLSASYLVLVTGSVKPVALFGALAGLAMVLALVGDLFILPALLLFRQRSAPEKARRSKAKAG